MVAQMQGAFLDNWIKTTGNVLHGDAYFPALENSGEQEMQVFMSSPEGGSDSMRLMYLTAITAAARRIDMEAAYFIPDRLMIRELVSARERGVRIRVLVPGSHIDSIYSTATKYDKYLAILVGILIVAYIAHRVLKARAARAATAQPPDEPEV